MKKRWLSVLLVLAMLLGLASMTALAASEEQPRLMYCGVHQNGDEWVEGTREDGSPVLWGFSDQTYQPNPYGISYVFLYYGTSDDYVRLDGGTLTSADPAVMVVESPTEDAPYYQFRPSGFGTTTLTYTDGTNTYTADVTVCIPTYVAWYKERERSEETFIREMDYDPDVGLTLWLMRENGFTAEQTANPTVYLNNVARTDITLETVALESDPDKYDIKVTVPTDIELASDLTHLRVACDGINTTLWLNKAGAPLGAAFYKERARSEVNLVESAEYDSEAGLTLWLMSKSGFTADEVGNLTVSCSGISYEGMTAVAVAREEDGTKFDVKVTLAKNLPLTIYANNLWVSGTSISKELPLTVKEYPRLMYKQMADMGNGMVEFVTQDGKTPCYTVSDQFNVPLSGSYNARFVYGTSDNNVIVDSLTVTEGDSLVVTEKVAADGKPYWTLQYDKFGTSTLTAVVGDQYYTSQWTVGLPTHGFYTARSRDEEHFTKKSAYSELTDSTVWLMSGAGYTQEDIDSLTIYAGETQLTPEAVLRDDSTDRYDLKLTLPAPAGSSGYQLRAVHSYWGDVATMEVTSERGIEYTINSITLKGSDYQPIDAIPADNFYAEVSVTNLSSTSTDSLILAAYNKDGKMLGMWFMYSNPLVGQTVVLGSLIDNSDGEIATLQALMLPMLGSFVPLANSVSIGV